MPMSLQPIPQGVAIVDQGGAITEFFRLRWQSLIDGFQLVPTKVNDSTTAVAKTAALATTTAFTTVQNGRYRITVYLRKTVADGVASTLTLTIGWTDNGTPITKTFAALALDTASANDSQSYVVNADAVTNLTWAVGYTSTTPAKMTWNGYVLIELLA